MSQPAGSIEKEIDRVKERKEIPLDDCWNVEALYLSWDAWEKDVEKWARPVLKPHWPEFDAFRGKLSDPKMVAELLEKTFTIDRALSKLYTYAHLRHDEDVSAEQPNKAYTRMVSFLYEFREELSWVEPELLQLEEKVIQNILDSDAVKDYRIHLEKILRFKPYTLSAEMEKLMALSGKALETSQRTFGVLNNADIKFASVTDSEGNVREVSHGKYHLYLRSPDRLLRKAAFCSVHDSFLKFENTFCELIQGQMQRHVFEKKARGYSSCLQSALFPHQVDESVYKSLIAAVHKQLLKKTP